MRLEGCKVGVGPRVGLRVGSSSGLPVCRGEVGASKVGPTIRLLGALVMGKDEGIGVSIGVIVGTEVGTSEVRLRVRLLGALETLGLGVTYAVGE